MTQKQHFGERKEGEGRKKEEAATKTNVWITRKEGGEGRKEEQEEEKGSDELCQDSLFFTHDSV